MAVNCKCGTYRPYWKEIEGRNIAHAMHLDSCVNCGYVPGFGKRISKPIAKLKPELGDRVESALSKIGADKVTEAITKVTGFDCGCNKRKERLNEFSRKFGKS